MIKVTTASGAPTMWLILQEVDPEIGQTHEAFELTMGWSFVAINSLAVELAMRWILWPFERDSELAGISSRLNRIHPDGRLLKPRLNMKSYYYSMGHRFRLPANPNK